MKRKTFTRMPSKIAALVFAAVLALTGVMPAAALSADITESGLYMIGFKSAQASGGGGGTGDGGYYPGANFLPAEEPEEEPEVDSELLDITPLVAAIVTNTAMSVEVTAQTLLHM